MAKFQSTRPRGARRKMEQAGLDTGKVSIHAPAWGATLPRSAASPEKLFQSTRPRGARLGVVRHVLEHLRVSIHAPAWGATSSPRGRR